MPLRFASLAVLLLTGSALAQNPLDVTADTVDGNPLDPKPKADAAYPAWLKPGARVSYQIGAANNAGNRRQLVPDEDPNSTSGWRNKIGPAFDGHNISGVRQTTILAADEKGIAAETTLLNLFQYGSGDVQTGTVSGETGTSDRFGEMWVHPAKLAAMPDSDKNGVKVYRLDYPMGAKRFRALAIATETPAASFCHLYDLESGLLLNYVSQTSGGTGTTITTVRLMGVRETKLPWAASAPPAWLKRGAKITLEGQWAMVNPGLPPVGTPTRVTFTIDDLRGAWALGKQVTESFPMGREPQRGELPRVFGPAAALPLWLDPRTLANVPAGKELDIDPITKFRVVFVGAQNGVMIRQESPAEQTTVIYDPASGAMVGLLQEKKFGDGKMVTSLQAVRGR